MACKNRQLSLFTWSTNYILRAYNRKQNTKTGKMKNDLTGKNTFIILGYNRSRK